jgi:hypothetical protein
MNVSDVVTRRPKSKPRRLHPLRLPQIDRNLQAVAKRRGALAMADDENFGVDDGLNGARQASITQVLPLMFVILHKVRMSSRRSSPSAASRVARDQSQLCRRSGEMVAGGYLTPACASMMLAV